MANFTFDPETHTYRLDGEEIPSVTQIIRFLSVDVDKTRPWLRDAAAERGSAVHAACALLDYGEPDAPDTIPPEFGGYLSAYAAFLRDYAPQWRFIERPMYGEWGGKHFAGTLDRAGTMRGQNVILDIKTGSSGTTPVYSAQLTGYDKLLNPIGSRSHLYILALSRDGTYTLREYKADPELFSACFTLHNATKKKERKTKA